MESPAAPNNPDQVNEDLDAVPPVPPLPPSLARNGIDAEDHAAPDTSRKGRSTKRSMKSRGGEGYQSNPWGNNESGPVVDLESLLKGINGGEDDQKGNVAKPPY